MKVIQLKYSGIGYRRFFYITESEIVPLIRVHSQMEGTKNIELGYRDFGLWSFAFHFRFTGKYVFIAFEDGKKTVVLIVTIES